MTESVSGATTTRILVQAGRYALSCAVQEGHHGIHGGPAPSGGPPDVPICTGHRLPRGLLQAGTLHLGIFFLKLLTAGDGVLTRPAIFEWRS